MREGGLIEIVLTVILLKNAFVGDCFADQHTELFLFHGWSVKVGLGPIASFLVTKNDDLGFCVEWVTLAVWLDGVYAHGK